MQTKTKKGRLLLLIPLFLFPFTTLFFWALGGGSPAGSRELLSPVGGVNTSLPEADFKKERSLDKLGAYEKWKGDSLRLSNEKKNDPYWQKLTSTAEMGEPGEESGMTFRDWQKSDTPVKGYTPGENQQRVYDKLTHLQEVMRHQPQTGMVNSPSVAAGTDVHIRQLEAMIRGLKKDTVEDPELKRLDHMMDKLIVLQKGQAAEEDLPTISEVDESSIERDKAPFPGESRVGQTASQKDTTASVFLSLQEKDGDDLTARTSKAFIPEEQTVVTGGIVKILLNEDTWVRGEQLPVGTLLYGRVTLQKDRLLIDVSSVRSGTLFLPVDFTAYDLDGMPGLFIPGSSARDAATAGVDKGVRGINLNTYNPSLGAQAAGAGIKTAKSLLSKKIRAVKVTVPEGYELFLQTHQRNLAH